MDEVLRPQGRSLHPLLGAELSRLHGSPQQQVLSDQIAWVATADPTPTGEDLRDALAAHLWLLERASAADGLPLTAAGWMKPAMLTEFMTVLPAAAHWTRSATREMDVDIVWRFRDFLQHEGLLLTSNNSLRLTSAGEAAVADPAELWRFLTQRLVPTDSPFTGTAGTLLLLGLAAKGHQHLLMHLVAQLMTESGWPDEVGLVGLRELWPTYRQLVTRVLNVGPRPQLGGDQSRLSAAALAMIRDALFVTTDAQA